VLKNGEAWSSNGEEWLSSCGVRLSSGESGLSIVRRRGVAK
jgi:hypothetical protein